MSAAINQGARERARERESARERERGVYKKLSITWGLGRRPRGKDGEGERERESDKECIRKYSQRSGIASEDARDVICFNVSGDDLLVVPTTLSEERYVIVLSRVTLVGAPGLWPMPAQLKHGIVQRKASNSMRTNANHWPPATPMESRDFVAPWPSTTFSP
jgi:hypothetical protein